MSDAFVFRSVPRLRGMQPRSSELKYAFPRRASVDEKNLNSLVIPGEAGIRGFYVNNKLKLRHWIPLPRMTKLSLQPCLGSPETFSTPCGSIVNLEFRNLDLKEPRHP